MGLFYKDETGKEKPYYMGCYGIGLGRIIATIIENNVIKENESVKGFSLPINIAPYKIQIVYKEDKKEFAEKLYQDLNKHGISAIIDDRIDYSLGSRIKDCYVLGTPYIAIIGNQSDGVMIEVEETKTGKKFSKTIEEIIELVSP